MHCHHKRGQEAKPLSGSIPHASLAENRIYCHRAHLGIQNVLYLHPVTRSLQPVPDVAQVPLHFVSSQPRALSLATGNDIARVISCTHATTRQPAARAVCPAGLLPKCCALMSRWKLQGSMRGDRHPIIINADHGARATPRAPTGRVGRSRGTVERTNFTRNHSRGTIFPGCQTHDLHHHQTIARGTLEMRRGATRISCLRWCPRPRPMHTYLTTGLDLFAAAPLTHVFVPARRHDRIGDPEEGN